MQHLKTELEAFETPFYLYDLDLLKDTLEACKLASEKYQYKVHYALKANSNPAVLKEIVKHGFGADCVSGNEVIRAYEQGFDASEIVFAGVGKSDAEINAALDIGIGRFNVESLPELLVLNELAGEKGVKTTVNIRVNPNVQSYTHKNITTGLNENKFGVGLKHLAEIIALAPTLDHIVLGGLHFHIGSQITKMEAFKNLCLRVNEISAFCAQHNWTPDLLNLGGGLGIDYENPRKNPVPDFKALFDTINELLEVGSDQEVHFELGRSLVGQMGTLVSRVLYVKEGEKKRFLIIDAGMTELMRPALYQAMHKIENFSGANRDSHKSYEVVGPICESTDCFAKEVSLPEAQRKDLIFILSAGAYGESMANAYNLRKQNTYLAVKNGKLQVI